MTIASTAARVASAASARSRHSSRSIANDSSACSTAYTFRSGASNIPAGCDRQKRKFAPYVAAAIVLGLAACSSSSGTSWDDYCARVDGDERMTAAIVFAATPPGPDVVEQFDDARRGLVDIGAEGGAPDELADHFDVLAAGQTAEGASGSDTTEAVIAIAVTTSERC